jgi:hypothetical protein
MDAQVAPRPFREFDTVVLCSFLDVRVRQITILIGDVDYLIEPGDGVAHVLCVGQRFFALFGKCVNASWQATLRGEASMFVVSFPSPFRHVLAVLPPTSHNCN